MAKLQQKHKQHSQRAKWTEEGRKLLLEYITANPEKFQTSTARKEDGFKEAAKFINEALQTAYTPEHIYNQCTYLIQKHGVHLDRFFREGNACIPSPESNTNEASSESSRATQAASKITLQSNDQALETLAEDEPDQTVSTSSADGDRWQPENDVQDSSVNCEEQVISCLSCRTAALNVNQFGPSDGQIRRKMDDYRDRIRLNIRSYQTDSSFEDRFKGWGEIERDHPSLFNLITDSLGFSETESSVNALFRLDTMNVKRGDLLAIVIGYFMYQEIFNVEAFPEFFREKSLSMRLTRQAIKEQYGIVGELKIIQSMRKSLINDETFKQGGPPRKADKIAEKLHKILYPLLNNKQESGDRYMPDFKGGDSRLAKFQGQIVSVFENALLLSSELKLNPLDNHSFFWPVSGNPFNVRLMRAENDHALEDSKLYVRASIFPGLNVSCSEECTNFKPQNAGSLHGSCRNEHGDVISPAIVLVVRPG